MWVWIMTIINILTGVGKGLFSVRSESHVLKSKKLFQLWMKVISQHSVVKEWTNKCLIYTKLYYLRTVLEYLYTENHGIYPQTP